MKLNLKKDHVVYKEMRSNSYMLQNWYIMNNGHVLILIKMQNIHRTSMSCDVMKMQNIIDLKQNACFNLLTDSWARKWEDI